MTEGESALPLDRLRPRIRPRRFYELDARPKRPHYRPLAHLLGVGLAFDRNRRVEYIEDPSILGYSVAELEELALANLQRIHQTGCFTEAAPGVWRATFEDEFAAERMLLDDVFDELTLDGDPVVFLPAEDTIMVVGANDTDALDRAFTLAAERAKDPEGLLDFAFQRRAGKWEPFKGEGPISETQEYRVLFHLGPAYAVQHDLLTARFKGKSDAPVLADFMVHAVAKMSMTRWKKGERTWLPLTSVVELDDGSPEKTAGNLADVFELDPGALEAVADVWPERFETKRFPSAAVLAKFRKDLEEPGAAAPRRRTAIIVALAAVAFVLYIIFGRR
ncbi:MAG: hypothetical protein U0270_36150 [Labilithrix sp.]